MLLIMRLAFAFSHKRQECQNGQLLSQDTTSHAYLQYGLMWMRPKALEGEVWVRV